MKLPAAADVGMESCLVDCRCQAERAVVQHVVVGVLQAQVGLRSQVAVTCALVGDSDSRPEGGKRAVVGDVNRLGTNPRTMIQRLGGVASVVAWQFAAAFGQLGSSVSHIATCNVPDVTCWVAVTLVVKIA